MSLPSLAEQLGDGLLAARERRHISRRRQAAAVALSATTLRDLELGLDNPTLERIDVLTELLGLEVVLTVRDPIPQHPANT